MREGRFDQWDGVTIAELRGPQARTGPRRGPLTSLAFAFISVQ